MQFCAPPQNRAAFSLAEMLVVMSIIVIMMALVVPAVSNFGRATGLTTGGNLITNLAGFARQNAITKSTMTALVLLRAQGTEDDYRTFTVVEYAAGRGWAQVSAWEKLPTGVVVDRTGENDLGDVENGTFLKYSPRFPFLGGPGTGQPAQVNPPVPHLGKQVTSYAARIFMPSGSLQNPELPAQLRLVEGFIQGDQTILTRRGKDGKSANYYDIALIGATGIAKVDRP